MQDSLVIIPTYNEIENIDQIIRAVLSLGNEYQILVVDDSSPDGTATHVQQMMKEFPKRLHLEIRTQKEGLGPAYIHGFKWALEKRYLYIYEMDADFSHQPKNVPKLRQALLNGADLVVGSRYCDGVNVINWPMSRVLLSYMASLYVKFITRMKVTDPTAGFVGYTREALQEIMDYGIKFKGYAFQIEIKFTAWKKKMKIEEVTNVFINRKLGESKMSGKIITEALFGVFYIKLKSYFKK